METIWMFPGSVWHNFANYSTLYSDSRKKLHQDVSGLCTLCVDNAHFCINLLPENTALYEDSIKSRTMKARRVAWLLCMYLHCSRTYINCNILQQRTLGRHVHDTDIHKSTLVRILIPADRSIYRKHNTYIFSCECQTITRLLADNFNFNPHINKSVWIFDRLFAAMLISKVSLTTDCKLKSHTI